MAVTYPYDEEDGYYDTYGGPDVFGGDEWFGPTPQIQAPVEMPPSVAAWNQQFAAPPPVTSLENVPVTDPDLQRQLRQRQEGLAMNPPGGPWEGLVSLESGIPSAQEWEDALNTIASGSPDLTQEEAEDILIRQTDPGATAKALAGSYRSAIHGVESLTSPGMGATLVAGGALPLLSPRAAAIGGRVLAGGFGAHMASQVPQAAQRFGEAVGVGDTEQQFEAGTDLAQLLGFAGATGYHAAAPGPRPVEVPREFQREQLTPGEANAIRERQAAEVLRNVPEQPRAGEQGLPTQEGAQGVSQGGVPPGDAGRLVSPAEAGGREVPLTELEKGPVPTDPVERSNFETEFLTRAQAHNVEQGLAGGMRSVTEPDSPWVATVDAAGNVVVNRPVFSRWLSKLKPTDRAKAVQSLFSEEGIHSIALSEVTDATGNKVRLIPDAEIEGLWNGLSKPEQALIRESYGELDPTSTGLSPEAQYGHEYLRRQMQRMLREPVREKAEAKGYQWLKESAIDMIERVILAARRAVGSKASKTLDSMLGRMKDHLDAAREAKGMKPADWSALEAQTATAPRAMEKVAGEEEKPPLVPGLQGKSFENTTRAFAEMPATDAKGYKGKNGSNMTGLAWDLGSMAKTPEDVAVLRKMAEEMGAKGSELMAKGDFDGAMEIIGKQPAEAFEFATGVKMDGTPKWTTFEKFVKGYKPPVPDPKYTAAKAGGVEGAPRAMEKEFRPRRKDEHPADYETAKREFLGRFGVEESQGYQPSREEIERAIEAARALIPEAVASGNVKKARSLGNSILQNQRALENVPQNVPQTQNVPHGTIEGAPRATLKEKARDAGEKFVRLKNKVSHAFATRQNKQIASATKDAAENQARIMADQLGTGLELEAKKEFGQKQSKEARNAVIAVIESGGDRSRLAGFIAQTLNKPGGAEARAAAQFADANWDRLQPLAERFKDDMANQRAMEEAAGINVEERQNYFPHLFDSEMLPNQGAEFFGSRGTGGGGRFQAQRSFDTIYDAVEAGYGKAIRTLDAAEVIRQRVNSGARKVMDRAWVDSLRNVQDPTSGNPLLTDVHIDPNGVMLAPPGYEVKTVANGRPVAVHKGYGRFFDAITGVSQVAAFELAGLPVGEALMKGAAGIKHGTLLFDSFHASRMMQKATFLDPKTFGPQLVNPKTFGKKGVSLLEYADRDLSEAVRQGDISPEIAKWVRANRPNAQLLVERGLNVGQIHESLRADIIKSIPGIGKVIGGFNKWVFQKVTRGALMEAGLTEFERVSSANPTWSRQKVADKVAKDLNTYFGNLGRQGVFKSKTFQDLARLILLAPNWFESMAKSELYGYGQVGKAAVDTITGKPKIGSIGKGMVGGLVSYFIGTQLLNLATRGQPTWKNEEEGHKMDAWIPDVTGKTGGFFMSPMSVPAEITHDFLRYRRKKYDDSAEGAFQILKNKMGPYARSAYTMATGDTYKGRVTGTWNRAKEAALALVPVPIAAGGLTSDRPGQTQRQLTASAGFKTEPAETHRQQMATVHSRWMQEHPDPRVQRDYERMKQQTLPISQYRDMDRALDSGNKKKALAAIEEVRPFVKDDSTIMKRMRPFIGQGLNSRPKPLFHESAEVEQEFLNTLTDKQRELYDKALDDRMENWLLFLDVWPERGDRPEVPERKE